MATGLYQDTEIVERFLASVSASTISQPFVAPFDFDVLGMILNVGTAPGSTHAVSVNINDSPTSQIGGPLSSVGAYNLWTATNVPTITGTATNNLVVSQSDIFYGAGLLVQNSPYALNYPLPGPSGTQGYITAQSTTQTTINPVVSPPLVYKYSISGYGSGAPDNTYTDYNGVASTPASHVHAGDVLSFVVSGASLGSAANLQMELVMVKS